MGILVEMIIVIWSRGEKREESEEEEKSTGNGGDDRN